MEAAGDGHVDCVRMLIQYNSAINLRDRVIHNFYIPITYLSGGENCPDIRCFSR